MDISKEIIAKSCADFSNYKMTVFEIIKLFLAAKNHGNPDLINDNKYNFEKIDENIRDYIASFLIKNICKMFISEVNMPYPELMLYSIMTNIMKYDGLTEQLLKDAKI